MSDRDRNGWGLGDDQEPDVDLDEPALAPGKTSLTSGRRGRHHPSSPGKRAPSAMLPAPAAVQMRGDGARPGASAEEIRARAAAGVAGAGSPLPFGYLIQESFGRHDVSAIRTTTDATAKAASESIGASAYAHGEQIAFTAAPSLHTAAHEAAHVIQQRAGVSLDGGVGQAGDRYERAADAVADRVVAGQSAEDLLDGFEGTGAQPAVQREGPNGAGGAPSGDGGTNVPAEQEDCKLDPGSYVTKYADPLSLALGSELEGVAMPLDSAYATCTDAAKFAKLAVRSVAGAGKDLWGTLLRTLAPVSPSGTIDRGRDSDPNRLRKPEDPPIPRGSMEIAAELRTVAAELRGLYAPLLQAAVHRQVALYVQARNQAMFEAEDKVKHSLDPANPPQPKPETLIPAHPLDPAVIHALCSAGLVTVDLAKYRADNPAEQVKHDLATLRDVEGVKFDLERPECGKEMWNWLSIDKPKDATAPEVAKQIYGDPSLANLIVAAPPRYGFNGDYLTPGYKGPWDKLRWEHGGGPDLDHKDPAKQVVGGPVGDAIAKSQSSGSTGFGKAEIVQRMRSGLNALNGLKAKLTGCAMFSDLAAALGPVAERLDQRSKDCNADEAKALEWDAQSANQLDLIGHAVNGIDVAVGSADGFKGEVLPADEGVRAQLLTMRAPLRNMARLFVDVAVLSEQAQTARAKLTEANQAAKTYPIDMMEGLLTYIRSIINRAKGNQSLSAARIADMETRANDVRTRLVKARDTLVTDPKGAEGIIRTLQADIDSLQFEATLTCNMDACDAAIKNLNATIKNPIVPSVAGTFDPKVKARKDLVEWYDRWSQIHDMWISNDVVKMGRAEGLYREFVKSPDWVGKFEGIRLLLEESHDIEKWVAVGVMIGIAAVSAGAGVFVGGGLIGTVVEAGVFTGMSTALLQSDPTIGGVLMDFGVNLAMFGAMKIFSAGYKGLLGAEFADSALGEGIKFTVMLGGTAAARLAQEDAKKRHEKGEGLTSEEAKESVLMSVAELIGMAIGHHMGSKLLEGSPLRKSPRYDFKGVDVADETLAKEGTALESDAKGAGPKPGMIQRAKELLTRQRKNLEKKKGLLEKIKEDLDKGQQIEGVPKEAMEELRKGLAKDIGDMGKTIDAHKLAELMFELVPAGGPNEFLVSEAQLPRVHAQLREIGFKEGAMTTDPVTGARTMEFTDPTGKETIKITETKGDAEGVVKGPEQNLPKNKYGPTKADLADPMKHPEYPRWRAQCGSIGMSQAEADSLWRLIIEGLRDGKTGNFDVVAEHLVKYMKVPKGKAALWSGGIDLADYAIQQGRVPLESQEFYKATKGLKLYEDKKVVYQLWDRISARFVRQIEGEVNVYLREWDPSSVLITTELKELGAKSGVKIVYHAMDWVTSPTHVGEFSIEGEFVELDSAGNPQAKGASCPLSEADARNAVDVAKKRYQTDQAAKKAAGGGTVPTTNTVTPGAT
ncbi:MAG TPA: DUF4157 domain-containing protein, partial [Kofleriaceae bacterium]|nr:DUF4157 domain-containing protein [Kofleriaceae bacterium]